MPRLMGAATRIEMKHSPKMGDFFLMNMAFLFTRQKKWGEDIRFTAHGQESKNNATNRCDFFLKNKSRVEFGEKRAKWVWAIYNDLSRGHPKWWFSKGIPPKMALN